MKLYVWKINNWDCYCRYSVMAKSLEEAREIAVYALTKNKENDCNMCIGSDELDNYSDMSYEEKKGRIDRLWNRGNYVIRNWIRDAEPEIYEEEKLIWG